MTMRTIALVASTAILLLTLNTATLADSKDGPRRWTRTVKKNSEVVYKIVFLAGKKQAEFAVIGDGSTDVDVFVFDSAGKQIASDENLTDIGVVRWMPEKTQEFTIRVKNLGNDDNVCHMGHN